LNKRKRKDGTLSKVPRKRRGYEMRTIELTISQGNIRDAVAEFLGRVGVLHDNEDVTEIQFPGLTMESVPIKVTFRKQLEGKVSTM